MLVAGDAEIGDGLRESELALPMSLDEPIETRGGSDGTGADCRDRLPDARFGKA